MSDSEWTRTKFGDVVKLNTDRCADPLAEGIERYVGLEHIEPEDLRIRRWGLVTEGTTFTNRFKAGQVLFGKRRAYQRKVAVADFEGVCSGDIYVFEPKHDSLLPELLPFLCQTDDFFAHAVGTSAGSLSPRTNWTQLADYEFALPPMEEQLRIAELLRESESVLEFYREANSAASVCLDSLREYLFAENRTNSIPLAGVLTKIEAGKSLLGSDMPPLDGEYAVLKVSAVGRTDFLPNESKTLVDQRSFLPEYSINAGDLLITRANTPDLVGMACLVEQDFPNLMLSDKTLRLVPKPGISSKILREALWTARIRQQLKSVATGTGAAMKNISQEKMRNLVIPLPSNTSEDSKIFAKLFEVQMAVVAVMKRFQSIQMIHNKLINSVLTCDAD